MIWTLPRDRFERVAKYYPHIHLFGNWYLVRNRPRKFFTLIWTLTRVVPKEDVNDR